MKRGQKSGDWYRMDSASALYAALQTDEFSAVYRFSAIMAEPVRPELLQKAVDRVMPRFPGFGVRVRRGFFWFYFEPNTRPGPFVRADVRDPCRPVRFNQDDGWLVRFYYYDHRISVEVFHALADGAGALIFFRTLLGEYLRQCGWEIPTGPGMLDLNEEPSPEEMEDAYLRYSAARGHRVTHLERAYQNSGTREPFYTFHVTMGFVPVDRLLEQARRYGVSITEYLTAVLLWVLLNKQAAENPRRILPVALAVPVNLRSWFPTRTLRNFILTVRPDVDPRLGDYTFEQVVKRVHHYMRLHLDPHELRDIFSGNVRTKHHRLLKLMPAILKGAVMSLNYRLLGVAPYSGIYTNPGAFAVPEEMRGHIRYMEVVQGQASGVARCNCASISYGNRMNITFGGTERETDTEREFFRFLVREGIPVEIESNRVEPETKEE